MRKMPLNQIAFGKTDAFNELNTFGQEYFMESFVANPKYHIDDFLSGSRFFVCGKKGTGKSALLKYLECHFLKDESNLVFPIRFKSEIEQVDKDSFEEIASAPDNSTKNEKYDTSSILDQSSYVLVWKTFLINQIITRAGIEINWFQKGGDYKENQLLTIIENKIHASEQMSGFPPSKDVWKEYFGEDINGEETRKYILNNSLYRPRDIIRMMSAIHNQIGTSEKFTQEAFDKAQQEYSELMWTEIKDELRLSYSEDEVNAIFTLLNRITMPFTYEILSQRIAQLGKFYPRMPELLNSERLTQMLNKLYELGIIGNTGKPMNFVFLGRTALDLLGRMVIHTPLRNYFSVQYER